ncbi:MAG: HAMP domain-containing sensor histidine kinase [Cyanobacteria bacterium P01_C01_bin.118]
MVFTTSFLVKDTKDELTVDFEESDLERGSAVNYTINDASALDALRQQLALVAIATITTDNIGESSNLTIHYAEPDYDLKLCQLLNSHSFRRWVQQLSPFQPRQFEQAFGHIYCCQYQQAQEGGYNSGAQYLTVWSQTELTPLQQFCIEQQARYFYQLERQQQQHEQIQSRITGLEDVIRQIGHQLRTPLASIELCADILRVRASGEQEQAQVIQQLVRKLLSTLQRLTSQSTITAASQQDLQTIAQDSIQQLQPQLDQKRIALIGERPSYLLNVDAWQLQQVFNNLLSNAIAFSPENGIIEFSWHGYNSEVLIEIRDQGSGFSPEDLRNLFKQYYSRRPNGQGLGLTIAKKIVHNHGGNIWAKNLPRGGAQVSISLSRRC